MQNQPTQCSLMVLCVESDIRNVQNYSGGVMGLVFSWMNDDEVTGTMTAVDWSCRSRREWIDC